MTAAALEARELTSLCHSEPPQLAVLRAARDAPAAAYGWEAGISENEAMQRLLTLNKLIRGWRSPVNARKGPMMRTEEV